MANDSENKFSIKNILNKMSVRDWIILVLVIVCIGLFISQRYYREKADNIRVVYSDTIYQYKNKLDSAYVAKDIYVQTIKDLKANNAELYQEVKNLKDNPLVVTKVVTQTIIKEIPAQSDSMTTTKDSVTYDVWKNLYWSAKEKNDYYYIAGHTDVLTSFKSFKTVITDLSLKTSFTFDVIEDKKTKQLKFIGRSDNPYVQITNMEGVVVDPTKIESIKKRFHQNHWIIGPHVGVGIGSDLKFTPVISLGLTYSLFGF